MCVYVCVQYLHNRYLRKYYKSVTCVCKYKYMCVYHSVCMHFCDNEEEEESLGGAPSTDKSVLIDE
eukprot:m.173982 g.173982  ORF g.173982 m.173982 type:complete len:66 (-) comp31748_c1_seq1:139-336(-)